MLILSVLFAALAGFGTLIGRGIIGQPIGAYGIHCYGWALAVNAAAITALCLVGHQRSRARRPCRPERAITDPARVLPVAGPSTEDRSIGTMPSRRP